MLTRFVKTKVLKTDESPNLTILTEDAYLNDKIPCDELILPRYRTIFASIKKRMSKMIVGGIRNGHKINIRLQCELSKTIVCKKSLDAVDKYSREILHSCFLQPLTANLKSLSERWMGRRGVEVTAR